METKHTKTATAFLNDTFVSHPYHGRDTWIPKARALASIQLAVNERDELRAERDAALSVQKQLVEALERVTSHLESWRRDDTDGQATAETEACLFCARAAILAAKASS